MRLALLFLMLGPIALSTRATEPPAPAFTNLDGPWVLACGDVLIHIESEQHGHRLTLLGIAEAINPDDTAPRHLDRNNPRRDQRHRALADLELGELRQEDGGYSGTLYDPEHGRTFRVHAELVSEDVLRMRAFIGIRALGRTLYWQRLTAYRDRLDTLARTARRGASHNRLSGELQ
ncbi:MAG: DUF2147 domain-containing protein [Pseudomonadaceae bacterium]|nr:DUF2147 domain-containing protein [Pseudomonadaceae bacterium]